MKKIIIILSLAFVFDSCSKDTLENYLKSCPDLSGRISIEYDPSENPKFIVSPFTGEEVFPFGKLDIGNEAIMTIYGHQTGEVIGIGELVGEIITDGIRVDTLVLAQVNLGFIWSSVIENNKVTKKGEGGMEEPYPDPVIHEYSFSDEGFKMDDGI